MNIFVIQPDPGQAARELCDRHVVKMILESAQMLCSAFPQGTAPYKHAHKNHPCTIWARTTVENYEWLLTHGQEMCLEYQRRYNKVHKTSAVLDWLAEHKPALPSEGLTTFPQAMPEQYKGPNAIEAYRRYYIFDKTRFAYWKDPATIPDWFIAGCLAHNIAFKNGETIHEPA